MQQRWVQNAFPVPKAIDKDSTTKGTGQENLEIANTYTTTHGIPEQEDIEKDGQGYMSPKRSSSKIVAQRKLTAAILLSNNFAILD